jgi:hypothetical protein
MSTKSVANHTDNSLANAFPGQSPDDVRRAMTPGSLVVNRCIEAVAVLATHSDRGVHWMGIMPPDDAQVFIEGCGDDSIEWECIPISVHLPNLPASFKLGTGETNPDVSLVAHAELREAVQ